MDWLFYAGIAAVLAWAYLMLFHWGFWRCNQFLPEKTSKMKKWPSVVAIIPARNEADVIRRTLKSVATQNYPGTFQVILVNDSSTDDTKKQAETVKGRVTVIHAPPLSKGWAGKLWALHTGVKMAPKDADYFWFTDADIEHKPGVLKKLVEAALFDKRSMVSQMVKLHCQSFIERAFVPAFIFFFQMLYPFQAANSDRSKRAAAAGGCILIEKKWLNKIGGLTAMKGTLIDDCTLAKHVKEAGGRIWLGLGLQSHSIRPYTFKDFWMTVARTAYTQLKLSPFLLIGTIFSMAVIFASPPMLVFVGIYADVTNFWLLGGWGWLAMITLYWPTLKIYHLSPVWGVFLPIMAFLYQLMTVHSAIRHWLGRGGKWKGRHYDFGKKTG